MTGGPPYPPSQPFPPSQPYPPGVPPAPYPPPVAAPMPPPEKSVGAAYGLWCLGLIGLPGCHRLYLGEMGGGMFQLIGNLGSVIVVVFTLGICFPLLIIPVVIYVWWFIDLFLIPGMAEPKMMQHMYYQQQPPY